MRGSGVSRSVAGVCVGLLGLGLAVPAPAQPPDLRLMEAIRDGDRHAVRALLEEPVDVNARQSDGATALHWAVYLNDLGTAELLIAAGAVPDASNELGVTPLYLACENGNAPVVRVLLAAGATPHAVLPSGETALMTAARAGSVGAGRALLAHGADPDAALERGTPARRVSADWTLRHDLIGATPFWLAARFREPEIMRILAEHGADPLAAKAGDTAVVAAIQGGTTRGRFGIQTPDPNEEARRTVDAVTRALDAGANVNARTGSGDTALHLAATRRLDDIIRLLAERGATLDVRNARGQTPLGLALSGPQGLAALYSPGDADAATAALLRDLGATDEGAPLPPTPPQ